MIVPVKRHLQRLAVLVVITGPLLAHGFVVPPPPVPPPPPPNTSTTFGEGGGSAQNGALPGQGGGTSEAGVPTGGTGGPTNPVRPASSNGTGRATGAGGKGTTAGRSKPKDMQSPWEAKVQIEWKSVFLPLLKKEGYADAVGTIADGLTRPTSDGGWVREDRPSLVLVADPASTDHRHAIAGLDGDARFKAATRFFNCFRVEAAPAGGKTTDARLCAYDSQGNLIAEVTGQRKFAKSFELLENAWAKNGVSELQPKVPQMSYLLETKAFLDYRIRQIESAIVCPDCGHERDDVIEEIAKLRMRDQACDKAITELRTFVRK